jgi:hypothetical protein
MVELDRWVENNCGTIGRILKFEWLRWAKGITHVKASEIFTFRSQNLMESGSFRETNGELMQRSVLTEQIMM